MSLAEVFYLYPLSGKYLKYFVDREKEMDYGIRTLAERNGEVMGVIGSVGSGKTTFLYALEASYLRVNKDGKVLWTTGKEFLSPDFKVGKEYDTIFVDDCMSLTDEEAINLYQKMYDVARGRLVNIVYTDREHRGYDALKERKFSTTTKFLKMDVDMDKAIEVFKERLKRGGYENMFEEEALEHMAFRAVPNLRQMIQYGKEAQASTGKVVGITVDEVDATIMEVDADDIKSLGDIAVAVVNVLDEKVRKGAYSGINFVNLLRLVREEIHRKVNAAKVSQIIENLEDMGILIIKKEGREKYINTVYNLMGLNFKIKVFDKSKGLYRDRSERMYSRDGIIPSLGEG